MYDFDLIRAAGGPRGDFPAHPWADFDAAVLPDVHFGGGVPATDPDALEGAFWPISPVNGDATLQNAAIFEKELAEVEAKLQAAPDPKAEHLLFDRLARVRLKSWIAQLRGDAGAIPEAAGAEYRAWVEWLKAADPVVPAVPSEADRERTQAAMQRYAERRLEKARAEEADLEASGVRRNYEGKENDPGRLPG
jgi:hypothetical protein